MFGLELQNYDVGPKLEEFLQSWGSTVEDALKVVLYILPVSEDDLSSEIRFNAVQSAADLFTAFKAHILAAPSTILPAQLTNRKLIDLLTFILKATRCLQLMGEMYGVRKGGYVGGLRLAFRVEVLKLLIKVGIWRLSEFKIHIEEECFHILGPSGSPRRKLLGPEAGHSILDRTEISTQELLGDWSKETTVLSTFDTCEISPCRNLLFGHQKTAVIIAELLYQIRPVIHAFCLLQARTHRHWRPWILAIALDTVSVGILDHILLKEENPSPSNPPTPRSSTGTATSDSLSTKHRLLIEEELKRRRAGLVGGILLRQPFFDKFLGVICLRLDHIIKHIPILNLFNVLDTILAYRHFYFATSGT